MRRTTVSKNSICISLAKHIQMIFSSLLPAKETLFGRLAAEIVVSSDFDLSDGMQ